jgi:FMN phosphatase YigB (HAD superfamily)
LKSPSEFVHIGDSFDLDFKPALDLNFKSILMLHENFSETHTFNDNISKELKHVFENNLYATNLMDLYNKIITL